MKKILALILSLMMLFSTAMAENISFVVNNASVSMLEETINLSALEVKASVANEGDRSGLRLTLNYNGEPFTDIVLAMDGERLVLTADGLSSAYALDTSLLPLKMEAEDEEDDDKDVDIKLNPANVLALMNLLESWSKHLDTAITDMGEETADGVTTHTYGFNFTKEMVEELVLGLCDIIDKSPELAKTLAEEESLRKAYEQSGKSLRAEGTLAVNDDVINLNADVYTAEKESAETRSHIILMMSESEEKNLDTLGVDLFVSMFDASDELVDQVALGLTLNMNDETDSLYSAEGSLSLKALDTKGDMTLKMKLSSPEAQNDKLWNLVISDEKETAKLDTSWGQNEDTSVITLKLTEADGTSMLLGANYQAKDENAGTVTLSAASGEDTLLKAVADVAVETGDVNWLPAADVEALNLMSLTEEQMQKLNMEASLVMANMVLGVIGSSEDLMAVLTEANGGGN